jgi:hypothetical protein
MHLIEDAVSRGARPRPPSGWRTLLLTAALGAALPAAAAAQGFIATANTNRSATIEFAPAASGAQGFDRASVRLEYRFTACRGAGEPAVMLSWKLVPGSLSAGASYWYDGARHAVEATPSIRAVPLSGTAYSPAGAIGEVSYREATMTGQITGDCNTPGLNYAPVADLRSFADPDKPAAVAAFLNTLTFTPASAPEPLRDYAVEQQIRTDVRRAQQAAEEEERREAEALARREAEERARLEAEKVAGQSTSAALAGASSPPESPEEAARAQEEARRAEEVRRQEEAQRAGEEMRRQLEAEQREQQEREDAMVNAATSGAQAAMNAGLGFGGYYFALDGETYSDLFESLQGYGMGFDADFMYLDVGVLTGLYSDDFRETYESDGYSTLDDLNVTGYFGNAGLMLLLGMGDGNALGVSGGMMYAVTPDAEMYSPVGGLVARFGGFKLRFDMGFGDQPFMGGAGYISLGD